MYKKVSLILTIIFITQISFAYAQKGQAVVKGTISESSLLMPMDLISGSSGQPNILLKLEEYPDKKFMVNPALGFKSGLIPKDGNYDGKRVVGWKVQITYDSKAESGKKGSLIHVTALKLLNK